MLSGFIAGYDPGGNGSHGLAVGEYRDGACEGLATETLQDAASVIQRLQAYEGNLLAVGVDTIVHWGTGRSGWRPADKWLRKKYPEVRNSVMSPNGLFGAMPVSGMAVVCALRKEQPHLQITETHPKVLYHALTQTQSRYNYAEDAESMRHHLAVWLGREVKTRNDHEFDAAISVYAAYQGLVGAWCHDLFASAEGAGGLVCPAGPAHYWWPE